VRKALGQKFGVAEDSFRLLLDGQRVENTQTPKMLEMEDGDQVDAVLEQMGGCL
jgi:small ubiquitin-related modifier